MVPFGKQQEILCDLSTSSPKELSSVCHAGAERPPHRSGLQIIGLLRRTLFAGETQCFLQP